MRKPGLQLRNLGLEDCSVISECFKKQGWNKPIAQYHRYFREQEAGLRDVIIAVLGEEFAGYLTICWEANYQPFKKSNIPEIVDFNVLKKYQRQGIGTKLMDEAESRIKQVSDFAGIGFGVTQDYGAAQILYINRNYKPDGNGLVKDSQPLQYGDVVTVNDDLAFCLIKKL